MVNYKVIMIYSIINISILHAKEVATCYVARMFGGGKLHKSLVIHKFYPPNFNNVSCDINHYLKRLQHIPKLSDHDL